MSIQIPSNRSVKKVEPASTSWGFLHKDISIGPRFGDKKKEQFFYDLYNLLSSGLELVNAISLLDEEKQNGKNSIFAEINKIMLSGKSLAEAIQTTGHFSDFEFHSIRIGEQTGKLPNVLGHLKNHYERKNKLKRQVVNALSYPMLTVFVSIGVMIFLLRFLVPMFQETLRVFDAELPAVTQMVIRVSDFISDYSIPSLVLTVSGVLLIYFQRRASWYRKMTASLVVKIPIVGSLVKKVVVARFAQAMYLLFESKVHLMEGLDYTVGMTDFFPFERWIPEMKTKIGRGMSICRAIEETGFFDSRTITIIKIGEEVNDLGTSFKNIADQNGAYVEQKTSTLNTLLEPFLILFVAAVIIVVAIAMIVPIFEMGNQIKF